ncbi:MAG: hypothetical protein ACTSW2_06235 [Alphaproteobacteria bacterium]
MFTNLTANETPRSAFLRVFGAVALALALLLDMASGAHAQASAPCTTRIRMVEQLGSRFAEAPIAMGLASNGGLVELFASTDGTTWTVVVTNPRGLSCILAAGELWQDRRQVAQGPAV